MLARIALFELRYQLRRPIALISFLIFALLAFVLAAVSGAASDVGIPLHSPGRIALTLSFFGVLAMFLSLATIADVALRDGNSRMDAILRAQPVRTSMHFGPRFAGAYAVACLAFLGVVLGYVIGAVMPWVSATSAGAFRLEAYAVAILVIALPNVFATGALFFTVATLTHRLMATYLCAVVLLALVFVAPALLMNPGSQTWTAFLDPFGIYAFILDTLRWRSADRTARMIPLDGLLMWNRLLWIGIGSLLLILSFTLFSARERRPRAPRVEFPETSTPLVMIDRPIIAAGGVSVWDQLTLRTRHEARAILRSWTFIVLLILGLLVAVGVLFSVAAAGAIPMPPVTKDVVDAIAAVFTVVTVLVPIAYGGELIWRDRSAKIAQIVDATPAPDIVFLASKIVAMALVILTLLAIAMATGVAFECLNGACGTVDINFYLLKLILTIGLPALMFSVLAVFIQTVVNRKFVGLLIMLALIAVVGFAPELGINHKLARLFAIPDPHAPLTPGYVQSVVRALLYSGYWTGIAVLIAIASYLIWVRGLGSLWTRIAHASRALTPAVGAVSALALAGTAATGSYLYWTQEPEAITAVRIQSAPDGAIAAKIIGGPLAPQLSRRATR